MTPVAIAVTVCGLLLAAASAAFGPSAAATLAKLQKLFLLSGSALLLGPWIIKVINRLLVHAGVELQSEAEVEQRRLLVLSIAIPWFILFVVAEPGKPERFWWLWPLAVLFLAAFTTHILPRFGVAQPFIRISQALLIVALLVNPFLIERVNAWRSYGWAGMDAPEVQVVDYVADQLAAAGQDRAAIGYHIFIYRFMASYNVVNPEYKVGAELDLLFKYRRGIANTDTCPEGVSPADEYRIVRTTPMAETWAPREYFNIPLGANFHLMRQFGPYQVFKRAG
jgi:hypothetical protein